MTKPLLAILLLLPLSALTQTQVPNVFEDGTPASAAEVNENFEYVLENASGGGGCSATQQDNSVVIECADGTSGVIAGAGTVVTVPEGSVSGETPDVTDFAVGDFYWVDGNGAVLSEWISNPRDYGSVQWIRVRDSLGKEAYLETIDDLQVVVLRWGNVRFFYTQPDCGGTPFSEDLSSTAPSIVKLQGAYYVVDPNTCDTGLCNQPTIVKSTRYSDRITRGVVETTPEDCENYSQGQMRTVGALFTNYTPPAEWLNAAYPARLEQLP